MSRALRVIADPFVVAAPRGQRIRTRLRLSEQETSVLTEVGTLLGSLAAKDLAARCVLGRGSKHLGRAQRKRDLTSATSSRIAGSITAATDDQWQLAFANLYRDLFSLRDAIGVIEQRCAVPAGEVVATGRRSLRGYPTAAIRYAKQQRLQVLRARLADVERRIETGQVSIVRGGQRLLNSRHHLDTAGLSQVQWAQQWRARRLFLTADGEKDKAWGNETIRVNPDTGVLTLRLPTALAHLSNTNAVNFAGHKAPTYVFSAPVTFSYHHDDWAAQVASGAVSYTISIDPVKSRWYVDASWSTPTVPAPSLAALRSTNTLGVDLNADHLAGWVISPDGNPLGEPIRIELTITGSTSRRDGLLREAVSRLLDVATVNSCTSVTIEDLNFADARSTGRETMGNGKKGKRFRATVSGIPTAKFRDRLVGMAANRGISIIAVDPAYTSQWGAQHWARPLRAQTKSSSTKSNQSPTRHECAAVVIGRRGKQHRARTTTQHRSARRQRTTNGLSVSGAQPTDGTTRGNTGTDEGRGHTTPKTHRRESDEPVTPGPPRPFGRPEASTRHSAP